LSGDKRINLNLALKKLSIVKAFVFLKKAVSLLLLSLRKFFSRMDYVFGMQY